MNQARRTIARRIRTARKASGLTQHQLATLLGVSQSRIAHWETGRGAPRIEDIGLIARTLRMDCNALLA